MNEKEIVAGELAEKSLSHVELKQTSRGIGFEVKSPTNK